MCTAWFPTQRQPHLQEQEALQILHRLTLYKEIDMEGSTIGQCLTQSQVSLTQDASTGGFHA